MPEPIYCRAQRPKLADLHKIPYPSSNTVEPARQLESTAGGGVKREWSLVGQTDRAHAYVVIDDAIAYAPIGFGANGVPVPLTKCGFTVVNASSDLGQELVGEFEAFFDSATPIA